MCPLNRDLPAKVFLPIYKCLPAMKNFLPRVSLNSLIALIFLCLTLFSQAQASDHGGGGSGPEPLKFTVNLDASNGNNKYLQLEMVFETAKPEAQHSLTTLKPRLQHAMILLLSGESIDRLRTREGKHRLAADIIEVANKVIDESEKTGVKEVLFTSFIIQ